MEHAYTNELIHESSPYLLQHAYNPVQWYPWGPNALKKAKELDKPILVSIGYAACHWCHVMERESFENETVAAYMNEHFINIKIDREERPDLDHIYMDAVQALAGNGGWPLNVFLTTDAKPFYGGTYFPPEKAFNRPSWKDILYFIQDAWKKRRTEIEEQANTLLEHINSSGNLIAKNNLGKDFATGDRFTDAQCNLICDNMLKTADTIHGGFGNAPKFPQTFTIQYLLAYGNHFNNQKALDQALLSMNKMLEGGIYDHLAGGLARYSTDAAWLVPHFEKMLYDNALLVMVLCDAYQVTGDQFYKQAIEKTLGFFINEMKHPGGGFYAALDADSEGVEGKFYVWDKAEIDSILKEDASLFCKWYGITEKGNWEHKNILNIQHGNRNSSGSGQENEAVNKAIILACQEKLLIERNKRIKPATDDKILLSWNALLLTAFCKASAALGSDLYKKEAVWLHQFLVEKFNKGAGDLYHSYKNGEARHPASLDDYAYFIRASIALQELTPGEEYLLQAKRMTEFVIEHFQNKETGFFYYTHENQDDVIIRKTEVYDGAVPAGNSVMAENLLYLSVIFDERNWWLIANKMLKTLSDVIIKYPTSFGNWANLILHDTIGVDEIVITGNHAEKLIEEVLKIYRPGRVFQNAVIESKLPLLKNKIYADKPLIYLCKDYSCRKPVNDVTALKQLLKIH